MLKIYGERNTNTNYLSQLVALNLDCVELDGVAPVWLDKLQKALSIEEALKDVYFVASSGVNGGWKHRAVDKKVRVEEGLSFVTITKNPYSWLLSLYRNPYHQEHIKGMSFEEFLSTSWPTVGREGLGKEVVRNPVELWNIKNLSYRNLPASKTVTTTTEALFEAPQAIIDEISQRFDIPYKLDQFKNYERSTKEKSKDSSYYKDYYLNERWRSKLTPEAIKLINESLDQTLLDEFGYQLIQP